VLGDGIRGMRGHVWSQSKVILLGSSIGFGCPESPYAKSGFRIATDTNSFEKWSSKYCNSTLSHLSVFLSWLRSVHRMTPKFVMLTLGLLKPSPIHHSAAIVAGAVQFSGFRALPMGFR
jgi:hypothetical protein